MSILNTYTYYLSSQFRTTGSIYDFFISTPTISVTNHNKYRLKITDVVIPFSFTQLTTAFNTITYTITRTGYTTTNATITIPPGNYSILSLLSIIKTLLIASIISILGITITTFNFTYDRDTLAMTLGFFNETVATTISWNNPSLNLMLGLTSAVSFSNTVSQSSSQPVNVNPCSSLYIKSSNVKTNSYANISSNTSPSNILLKFPIQTGSSSILRYLNIYDTYIDIINTSINGFSLNITDNTGNDVILLLDWTITLQIEEIKNVDEFVYNGVLSPAPDKTISENNVLQTEINRLEQKKQKYIVKADKALNNILDENKI